MINKTTRSQANRAKLRFLDAISRNKEDLSASVLKQAVLDCKPDGSHGATAYKWDYLEREILAKFCDDSTDPKLRQSKAIDKMMLSEINCKKVNDEGFLPFDNDQGILMCAQQLIAGVLGDVTESFEVIEDHFSFTAGATTCRTRRFGDPYFKYDATRSLDVTRSALPYAKLLVQSVPLWDQKLATCDGNVVFTVPKDCDIDRAACKEPGLNQVLQSCIGSFIRTRLKKRCGIDLNDQSRNRRMARKGSRNGRYATIDLKSASDSISQRCVFELLPHRWVAFLDDLRSPQGRLPDGSHVIWEKHSTMGNGYTFELESLIFWALTRATILQTRSVAYLKTSKFPTTHVSVYGDDIICPSHWYSVVTTTLVAVGFTVNEKKSFSVGPFRESCGGHYYDGHDVKPFYIRKPVDSPDRLIWLLNALRRWASDDDGWCDPSIYPLWLKIRRKFVPAEFLGGRNLSSISEVMSPEEPRWSLLWVKPQRKIDGVRALLRWFQYNPIVEHLDSIRIKYTVRKERYIDRNNPNAGQVVDFNHIMDMGSREVLRTKRYSPTLVEISLFPQETVPEILLSSLRVND